MHIPHLTGDVGFSKKNVRISYKFCKKTVLLQICCLSLLHFCSVIDECKLDQFWMYWWWRKCNSKKNSKKNRKNLNPESWPSSYAQNHSFFTACAECACWQWRGWTLTCSTGLLPAARGALQNGRDGLCSLSLAHSCEPGCVYAHINKTCIHSESFTSLLWLCSLVV